MNNDFHVKYRPQDFDQVIGQDHVIKSLLEFQKTKKWPHAYLFTGGSGTGKCVVGSSIIPTEQGLLPIHDFDMDYGYHPLNLTVASKNGMDTTKFCYKEQVQQTIRIQNELGFELEGTPDHPILTINQDLEFNFKRLKDIEIGDLCVLRKNTQTFPKENPSIVFDQKRKNKDNSSSLVENIPIRFNEPLAKLLGYVIANGCNHNESGCILFSSKNTLLQKDVFGILSQLGWKKPHIDYSGRNQDFVLGSAWYGRFITHLLGYSLETARFKEVPNIVLRSTKSCQIAFLRGLFDCDSSYYNGVIELSTASKKLANQVQIMLLNLGIVSKRKSKWNPDYEHHYHLLWITSHDVDRYFSVVGSLKYTKIETTRNTNKDGIPCFSYVGKVLFDLRQQLNVSKNGTFNFNKKSLRFPLAFGRAIQLYTHQYFDKILTKGHCQDILQNYNQLMDEIEFDKDTEFTSKLESLFSSDHFRFCRITKKESRQKVTDVFDFNLPNSHCFVSNGYISHNTTIARILAAELDTHPSAIMEVDAATFNGVDTMRALTSDLQYTSFGDSATKFIILDECFAAGTLITTPLGTVPIEQIKKGDVIFNMTGQAKVRHTFANRIPLNRLVKIHLTNGEQLVCSCDHLFFTDRGWVKAKDLNKMTIVFSDDMQYTDYPNYFGSQSNETYLHSLWKFFSKSTYGKLFKKGLLTDLCNFVEKTTTQQTKDLLLPMSSMQEDVHAQKTYNHPVNMFSPLWQYFGGEQTDGRAYRRNQTSNKVRGAFFKKQQPEYLGEKKQSSFGTNETKQSINSSRSCCQDKTNQNGKRNSSHLGWTTGWQWLFKPTTIALSNGFGLESRKANRVGKSSFIRALETRAFHQNWTQYVRQKYLSASIQIRYWLSRFETVHRSGRRWAQLENEYRERFKKGSKTDGIGVDHIEIYQRGNNDQSFIGIIGDTERYQNFVTLYDLEIDGHPSYYAGGCLVHNCHMLSKAAWNALLKAIEEPPPHVYFAFCTTEAEKVPDTIKTRCHQYNLKSVSYDNLLELLTAICEIEGLSLPEKALPIIAQEAIGSPRRALTFLSKAQHCTKVEEVREVLESAEEDADVIELCRLLAGRTRATWRTAIGIVNRLDTKNPESIRLTVLAYTSKALLNTKADNDAEKLLAILEAFSKPCNISEKMAPILLSIGQLLLGGGE